MAITTTSPPTATERTPQRSAIERSTTGERIGAADGVDRDNIAEAYSPGVSAPSSSIRAPHHMVASADHLATSAGNSMFMLGGNAVDAAIATNAAIAVTAPHLCGMGGDLFALVHVEPAHGAGEVHALNASGRAGSGADPSALRAGGHRVMPFKRDIASVTVPGCVDGWFALHERFATLPLDVVLGPARQLAATGFPASPLLVGLARQPRRTVAPRAGRTRQSGDASGARVRRPGRGARARRPRSRWTGQLLLRAVRRRADRARRRTVQRRRPGRGPGRLGRSAQRTGIRCRPPHDRAELAGLPHARVVPPRRPARPPRRPRRPALGAPAHRVGDRRRLRPADRAPRRCGRSRAARCDRPPIRPDRRRGRVAPPRTRTRR